MLCVAMIMGSDRRDAEHLFFMMGEGARLIVVEILVVVVVFAVVVLNVPPTVAINYRPRCGSDS